MEEYNNYDETEKQNYIQNKNELIDKKLELINTIKKSKSSAIITSVELFTVIVLISLCQNVVSLDALISLLIGDIIIFRVTDIGENGSRIFRFFTKIKLKKEIHKLTEKEIQIINKKLIKNIDKEEIPEETKENLYSYHYNKNNESIESKIKLNGPVKKKKIK